MPEWVLSVFAGLLMGAVVSIINHYIMLNGFKRGENLPPVKAKGIIMMCFWLRILIDGVTMFGVFFLFRDLPMLIAVAVGLTLNKNVLFIKQLINATTGKR